MYATMAKAGWRPGWDLAGPIIKQATDGTGPQVGSRVMGSVNAGSWAEQVAVPTDRPATIPDGVTFGTVIGKALRLLGAGQGLIPILIALQ